MSSLFLHLFLALKMLINMLRHFMLRLGVILHKRQLCHRKYQYIRSIHQCILTQTTLQSPKELSNHLLKDFHPMSATCTPCNNFNMPKTADKMKTYKTMKTCYLWCETCYLKCKLLRSKIYQR